jgi:hypothetical protein
MGKPINRRVAFSPGTWHVLSCLALSSGRSFQELANEAFRDLRRKHRQPATLLDALRESVRMQPANEQSLATVHRLRITRKTT